MNGNACLPSFTAKHIKLTGPIGVVSRTVLSRLVMLFLLELSVMWWFD